MRIIKLFVALLSLTVPAIFMLSGCASKETPTIRVINDDRNVKQAEVALAQASQSISSSLQELTAIESTTHPAQKLPNPMDAEMIGMAELVSIDWSGAVGPLVTKIAALSHYRVNSLGVPPAIPIIVSVTAKDTPLADILRDANFQCGIRASITVYPATKIIELRYARN